MRDITQAWSAFMLKYGRYFYTIYTKTTTTSQLVSKNGEMGLRFIQHQRHEHCIINRWGQNSSQSVSQLQQSLPIEDIQVSSQLNRNTNNSSRNTHIILPTSQSYQNDSNRRERRERLYVGWWLIEVIRGPATDTQSWTNQHWTHW